MNNEFNGQSGGHYGPNPWAYAGMGQPPYGSPVMPMAQMMEYALQQWMLMLRMAQLLPQPAMQQVIQQMGALANSWLMTFTGTGPWYSGTQGAPYPGMGPFAWPQSTTASGGGWGDMSPELAAFLNSAGAANSETGSVPGESAGARFETNAIPAVNVRVRARLPTEVIPNLLPGSSADDLFAEPLHTFARDLEPITSVHIGRAADGDLAITVLVPDGQPPGRYSGPIRTGQGDFVGGLTVIVHPEPGSGL